MATEVLETVELEGGVVKEITFRGEGERPKTGDKVSAHYTGRLLDGSVFDSSVRRGTPFKVSRTRGGSRPDALPARAPHPRGHTGIARARSSRWDAGR